MKVIAISGKAEAGKTYTAKALENILNSKGYSTKILPLAYELKKIAIAVGWNCKKDEKGRKFLQALGGVIKDYNGKECFARATINKALKHDPDFLIIDDLRLRDEYNFLYIRFDTVFIRVERPGHDNMLTEEQRKDVSEVDLDAFRFDLTLYNDGTDRFDKQIEKKVVDDYLDRHGFLRSNEDRAEKNNSR